MWKIYKENNSDLNFVLANLYSEAISINEFNMWVNMVISHMSIDEIPDYFFDLVDFNQSLFHISKIIGFVPDNDLSETEQNALIGIALIRNITPYESYITKEKAIKILENNPHVLNKYRLFFPFIEI